MLCSESDEHESPGKAHLVPRLLSSVGLLWQVERIGSQSSGFLGARASGDAFKAMSGLVNRVRPWATASACPCINRHSRDSAGF